MATISKKRMSGSERAERDRKVLKEQKLLASSDLRHARSPIKWADASIEVGEIDEHGSIPVTVEFTVSGENAMSIGTAQFSLDPRTGEGEFEGYDVEVAD